MLGANPRALALTLAGLMTAQVAPALAEFELSYSDGTFTLAAEDAPLVQVLHALAAKAKFDLVQKGYAERTLSLQLTEAPLDDGLRRLVGDLSMVLIYREAVPYQLEKVIVKGNRPGPTVVLETAGPFLTNRFGLDLIAETDKTLRRELGRLSPKSRAEAMEWLVEQGGEGAVSTLGHFLALDEAPEVRLEAAIALARIDVAEAAIALETGLGDQDPNVRFQTVESLGKMTSPRSTLALGQVLFSEPDGQTRAAATAALGGIRSEAAYAFLQSAAQDSDPKVREIAEQLLLSWD